ncbi:MAG: FHA domain-containing protein [Pyrinomonadaceae bacterium]
MKTKASAFIITREDQAVDPVTLLTEGLTIGRLPDCELVLNHPTVSRIHAGIKESDGTFYLFHLSPSNSTTLNGNLVEEKEALADGDVVQIGPFFLYVGRADKALSLRVVYQTAVRIGDAEILIEDAHASSAQQEAAAHQHIAEQAKGEGAQGAAKSDADALDVFWEKRKREAGKITRASALRPRTPPRLGKARFNWVPTRDLGRPWPFSVFTWGAVAVGVFAIVAAYSFTSAYSPAPISNPHQRASLDVTPAIAREPNANSCTTCHSLTGSMEAKCASCHQTEAFNPEVIDPHAAAGIGCVTCHTEHRGAEFRPGLATLNASFQPGKLDRENTCSGCHNDANQKTFNGKSVHTPHGGTFGYPIVNGQWEWEGLGDKAWSQKPEKLRQMMSQWKVDNDRDKRSAQFHVLHMYRVRAIAGMPANLDGELSCSSCHKSFVGANLDRETPRQTCAGCHGGLKDARTNTVVFGPETPNCNSCHRQHIFDKRHWNPMLMTVWPEKIAAVETRPDRGSPLLASSHR